MSVLSLLLFVSSYLDITCTRNGDHILREEPSERNLSRRGIVLLPYLLDFFHDLKHVREVLLRIPRNDAPKIALFKVIGARLKSSFLGSAHDEELLVLRTYLPVRIPLPRGEYANTVTPSSRAACRAPIFGSSGSRVNGEYSTWIAAIGWTLYARRKVSPLHSHRPMYLILPSLQTKMKP